MAGETRIGTPVEVLLLLPGWCSPRRTLGSTYARAPDALPSMGYAPSDAANDLLYRSSIVAQRLEVFGAYIQEPGLDRLHPVTRAVSSASVGYDAMRAYWGIFGLQRHRRWEGTSSWAASRISRICSTSAPWLCRLGGGRNAWAARYPSG
ncbi:hypothetical protein GGR56DRAFT_638080 [Xylariaceae sp. FL0804]|nr:hypothetical protein GGR56DRAFT_638080 [Xylariaceae sp. FL0804]